MGTTVYLDCVSTEAPKHRADHAPWYAHPLRIAIAVQREDRTVDPVLALLVLPDPAWPVELEWCARYGVRAAEVKAAMSGTTSSPATAVAAAVLPLLRGDVTPVAHNWPFHKDCIDGLMQDAGRNDVPLGIGYCTMRGSKEALGLRAKNGGLKPPSLMEAARHFNPEFPGAAVHENWIASAVEKLNAVRTVHWGIRGWGVPGLVTAADTRQTP